MACTTQTASSSGPDEYITALADEIKKADADVYDAEYLFGVSGGIESHRVLVEVRGRRAGLRRAYELYRKHR